jgi:hypothetical protein
MERAIHFEPPLVLAMEHCKARRQCFFIDACRNEPNELRDLRSMGDAEILEPRISASDDRARDWPILYATTRDRLAHARPGKISRFTGALLTAFEGAGSEDPAGSWVVDSDSLGRGIKAVLDLENHRLDKPRHQSARVAGESGRFALHHHLRAEPRVPVAIRCRPDHAAGTGSLRVTCSGSEVSHLPPDALGWLLELEARPDAYDLCYEPDGATPLSAISLLVRPSHRERTFEVAS